MNIRVMKHDRSMSVQPPPYMVYVGRTRSAGRYYSRALHVLANPFPLSKDMSRKRSVQMYRERLVQHVKQKDPDVTRALDELVETHKEHGQLVLVCHCIDTRNIDGSYCHAQVIARAVRRLAEEIEMDERSHDVADEHAKAAVVGYDGDHIY